MEYKKKAIHYLNETYLFAEALFYIFTQLDTVSLCLTNVIWYVEVVCYVFRIPPKKLP